MVVVYAYPSGISTKPILFDEFINGLGDVIECALSKVVSKASVAEMVDSLVDTAAVQRDSVKLMRELRRT